MAEMRRSFHSVKSLLGKLDRSIDEARSRRLGDPAPAAEGPDSGDNDGLETVIGRAESGRVPASDASDGAIGNDTNGAPPANQTVASPRRSVYGRAKPLRRADDGSPTGQWSG